MSAFFFSLLWTVLAAQPAPPPQSLTFDQLLSSVPQPPPGAGGPTVDAQQFTVRWSGSGGSAQAGGALPAAPPPDSRFEVTARQDAGPMPVERAPELSRDRLVIVGTDDSGTIVSWSIAADPRVLRAELPGPDGSLRGQTFYRTSVDLLAVLPNLPQIVQAGVYQPNWNGSSWVLTLVGSFDLGAGR
jgi:hypothetical protein